METFELVEGENCWRVTEVERGRFLLSGREYFNALRAAMIQSRKSVYILAWDLSERIEMVRMEEDEDGYPSGTADFIFALLDEKPELEIHILLWDYSVVYLAEREWLPFTRWRRENHPRLHFEVDDALPAGASHHQKVVVIDESVAFCGGFDLSAWRWDTVKHRPEDPCRKTPKGKLYQPLHDLQVMLEGKVVDDLSDLFAMRWERATGKTIPRKGVKPEGSPWPDDLPADIEHQEAALALTFAKYNEYEASFHNEKLYLDTIYAAEDYIYIENQYLSSHLLVKALEKRLSEEAGPEVIIILTRDTGGWMEEGTMGLLRDRLLEILKKADKYNRLSAFYPHVRDDSGNESQVYVHAKLMIVDDQLIRIGSANLSNRSMKVDSEVDLVMMKPSKSENFRSLLIRLLGIHFNTDLSTVEEALKESGSIGKAIDELGEGKSHRLREIEIGQNPVLLKKLSDTQILDPDEPIGPGYWIREATEHLQPMKKKNIELAVIIKISIGLLVLIGLVILIKAGWGGVITRESAINYIENIRNHPASIPILFLTFLVAGLIAVPINLLLVAGTIVIGPWVTLLCGFTGSLLSAAAGFGIGHGVGKPLARKLAGDKLDKLSNLGGSRGLLSVAMLRVLPIAPFPVINIAAGSSGLHFSTYIYGSILGMLPGMVAVVLLSYQIEAAVLNPNMKTISILIAAVLIFCLSVFYLYKRIKE